MPQGVSDCFAAHRQTLPNRFSTNMVLPVHARISQRVARLIPVIGVKEMTRISLGFHALSIR